MRRFFKKRTIILQSAGFSLIELLVVMAIIGLLSTILFTTFSGARKASRDARRITDLEQVAHALEAYYAKCRMFPGSFNVSTSACEGGVISGAEGKNPASWDDLEAILIDAEIGVSSIPRDPVDASSYTYSYSVQLQSMGIPRAQCYVLEAEFETKHPALEDDIDTADIEKKLPTKGSSISSKNLFPINPSCDDSGDERGYCAGNRECFYGL